MCAIARYRHSSLALLALLVLSACGNPDSARTCSAASECGPLSWCRDGYCVSNAAPLAVIEPPAAPTTHRLLTFGGGASRDPDGEDAVAAWHWTVRGSGTAAADGCLALPSEGTAMDLVVVFPCAGEYDVALEVLDRKGTASAPSTVRTQVALSADPPTVAAGADLAVDHRCAGTPLACATWDGASSVLPLTATASGPPATTFSYRWTVEPPPELAPLPAPRVVFEPSAEVAAPRVTLATDGTAIAGRYTFTVTATDSRGLVAVARQRVDVGNRPPVLTGGGALEIPHGFEAATRRFVASGATSPATWSDPDGDPVVSLGYTALHTGDGGALLAVEDRGDRAGVTVVVPYDAPADAARLIGPGVRRRVELAVADVNGARASTGWDLTIGNRPPRTASAVGEVRVDHRFDAATGAWRAEAPISTFADEDGDPVELELSGDVACAGLTQTRGAATVACAQPWGGVAGALAAFVGTHAVTVTPRDPFGPGTPERSTVVVGNRPPRVLASQALVVATCTPTVACCDLGSGGQKCLEHDFTWSPSSAAPALVEDDDGDPVDLLPAADGTCLSATAPPAAPCGAGGCTVSLSLCGGRSACNAFGPAGTLALTASDGVATATGLVSVDATCAP
jgi:hypothetical protein